VGYVSIRDNIGGQTRAHFFKSVHKSAKCAFGRKNAHFFDVLQTFLQTLCRLFLTFCTRVAHFK
jgi:hypothetical protein